MRRTAPGGFFLIRLLTGLVGIGTPILLARTMSVTDFATYATITAASGLIMAVSSLGFDRACLRLLPGYAGVASLSALARFIGLITVPRMLALALALMVVVLSGIWLPAATEADHSALLLVLFSLTTGASQLAASFTQGLLLHGAYAAIVLMSVITRFVILVVLAYLGETLTYERVIEIFTVTEFLVLLAQLAVIGWSALHWSGKDQRAVVVPSLREVLAISNANYLSYLAGLPWMGSTLVLLVGNFCSHEITAAFAFFQNLVERAKSFMPIRMLQSFVEPQWARLHQLDGRVRRFQVPTAILQKTNALLLSLGLVWIVAAGDPLLRQLIRPIYADHLLLLSLILIQQAIGSIADLLWMGLNATNQIGKLTRAFVLVSVGAAPMLILAVMFGGAVGLIIWSWMPPLILLVLLRRSGAHFAKLALKTRQTALILLIGGIAGILGWSVQTLVGQGAPAVAGALLLATVTWYAMLVFFKPFNRAERYLLKQFIYVKKQLHKI